VGSQQDIPVISTSAMENEKCLLRSLQQDEVSWRNGTMTIWQHRIGIKYGLIIVNQH